MEVGKSWDKLRSWRKGKEGENKSLERWKAKSACAKEINASENTGWGQGLCLKPSEEETYSLQISSKEWKIRCGEGEGIYLE